MLLKQVVLRNIRSYQDQAIDLPEGVVLLSGDIGSGKSTILLAVEFALFGLLKGEIAGAALLRNGANEGSVELFFELNKKGYRVGRSLKRTKKSIKQDSGFLEVDGAREKLTPMELKSRVLELIGYPEELLTKSKSLIYRYTVYTPQEDMKRILEENPEDRLKILRSVFDVEKYQRIRSNASLYTKDMRERIRHFEGQLIDLEIKKKQKRDSESELEGFQKKLSALGPLLRQARALVLEKRERLSSVEKSKSELDSLRRDLHGLETKKESLSSHLESLKSDLEELDKRISVMQESVKPVEDVSDQVSRKLEHIRELEKRLMEHNGRVAEFSVKRKDSQELAMRIRGLSECPTCFQVVLEEHKSKIINDQKQRMREYYDQESSLKSESDRVRDMLERHRQELEDLRKKQQESAVHKERVNALEEHRQRRERYREQIADAESRLKEVDGSILEKSKNIEELSPVLKDFELLKSELDRALAEERDVSVEHARLSERVEFLERSLSRIAKEVNDKELARLKMEKVAETHSWLDDKFIPMMGEVERHVMAKIQEEFNDTFVRWFGMLIEDDLMTASLDDAFTPVISQNGYETDVSFLSGGEKTACALAYRLALNRTINSLLSSVRTKDLLILDEPTDGFSDEQLDKMRDVLDDLGLRQVVLVSHEQKIESFADSIIRVQKEAHISRVL